MKKSTQNAQSIKHESAHLHVTGEARFIDDHPSVEGTLYAAFVLSEQAHASITAIDLSAIQNLADVVAVIDAKDIKGRNSCGPILADNPILVEDEVSYIGQPILMVVATSYLGARKAAKKVTVEYSNLETVLTAKQAHHQQSYVMPPTFLKHGDSKQSQTDVHIKQSFSIGGQEHFYLEGQIATVIPKEDDCFDIFCSTQHPTEMQKLVAKTLQCADNQIRVEMRRMGGGFGGKESQSALFCCAAAVAAQKLKCPIKCRLDRDDDMLITGKRHPFDYSAALFADNSGKIQNYQLEMLLDCGFSADLSPPVAARALCHSDNAYYLPAADLSVYLCKTNKQSNTAFRGFGGPQGAFAIEYMLDTLARTLRLDALGVRKNNFYQGNQQKTPYGQTVDDNVLNELVSELEQSSHYRQRREQINRFNQQSTIIKKGLALTPVKFGISFNVVHFNQAAALVHVYTDGSVLVNHGGTEMGQGLHTKVAQIVAETLGLSMQKVRVTATDTSKVANTSATAASTGSDLNSMAALDAAMQIKQRLTTFLCEKHGLENTQIEFADGQVMAGASQYSFKQVVQLAYQNRVQLWSDGFYKTPDLNWDPKKFKGSPFYYYAYGASVSEVAIDTLTGESKLLRADLLHEAGQSINPAIDVGQIEGAFIQGVGWLTQEQLFWNDKGQLLTHAPSTYKIPAVSDCPEEFHVKLFDKKNLKPTIKGSKAVGEPPLLLGFSTFFAIRDAISSVCQHKVNPPLNAPATAEEILKTIQFCKQQVD